MFSRHVFFQEASVFSSRFFSRGECFLVTFFFKRRVFSRHVFFQEASVFSSRSLPNQKVSFELLATPNPVGKHLGIVYLLRVQLRKQT